MPTPTRYFDLSQSSFILRNDLVIVERCPPPPPKPQQIIYEKYLPPPPPPQRQIIVQREACQPAPACTCTCTCSAPPPQPVACRRLVREVVRQVPQCTPAQPAVVCTPQNQQKVTPAQSQVVQQLVPVFAQRQVSFRKRMNVSSYI